MLPARTVENSAVRRMWWVHAVVVVLPFEPVIPISWPRKKRSASSISLQSGKPSARAFSSSGTSVGTPGLAMTSSCPLRTLAAPLPSSSRTPASRNLSAFSRNSPAVLVSLAVTIAPRAAQKSAVARPVRASPTTSTRFPFRSILPTIPSPILHLTDPVSLLPELQRGERKQRKHQRHDPESHNDF